MVCYLWCWFGCFCLMIWVKLIVGFNSVAVIACLYGFVVLILIKCLCLFALVG